jgi:hypothetical protein
MRDMEELCTPRYIKCRAGHSWQRCTNMFLRYGILNNVADGAYSSVSSTLAYGHRRRAVLDRLGAVFDTARPDQQRRDGLVDRRVDAFMSG